MTEYLFSNPLRYAGQQANELWSEIETSPYEALPPIESARIMDNLKLLCPNFNNQAFVHRGDTLEKDRLKLLHSFGTNVRIAFEASRESVFSGIFSSGAEYGILRLSLAVPPKKGIIVPGIAIKLFVDNHESLNILAIYSLEGQKEANLFTHPFSTMVDPPRWNDPIGKIVNFTFGRGLREAGFSSISSTTALSNYHLASISADGIKMMSSAPPFKLVFKATLEAQQLLGNLKDGALFREALEGRGMGTTLFEVYGTIGPEGQEFYIGTIKATSNFTASSFADKQLFFRHPQPLPHLD